jgi:hypothetical protein
MSLGFRLSICPSGVRHRGSVNADYGSYVELREPSAMMQKERRKQRCKARSNEVSPRDRRALCGDESGIIAVEQRGSVTMPLLQANRVTGRSLCQQQNRLRLRNDWYGTRSIGSR